MNPLKQDVEKKRLYTIVERVDSGKVVIQNNSGRKRPISAGSNYSVGDRVLVVSGVIVGTAATPVVKTFEV